MRKADLDPVKSYHFYSDIKEAYGLWRKEINVKDDLMPMFFRGGILFLILVTAYSLTAEYSGKPLHHCFDTPKTHQLWLRRSDASRVLVGTMPLSLSAPLVLLPDDRLVTEECE